MKAKGISVKKIEADIKKIESFNDRVSIMISQLYQDKNNEKEREKRVIVERITSLLQGKEIVFENSIPFK